jgi:parallel beta-helix repeat protein
MNRLRTIALAAGGAALASPLLWAVPAQAQPAPQTAYVSASPNGAGHDCGPAAYRSIAAAVSATPAGGTIVVCGGTYREDVAVAKPLTIESRGNVTIDAANLVNGFLITAPHVTVSGFTVRNAIGEGILVDHTNDVTVQNNVVTGNDLGARPGDPVPNGYAECQAAGGVPGDCGEGIHLMGVTGSTVRGNVSTGNSGGILLSDETGPTAHNQISGNVVTGNVSDCGITVVGHNPNAAPGGVPAPAIAGVFGNDIAGNGISGNGTAGEGAGVVIATGLPGGAVYDNTVENNSINGNGMSGVTVHSHVPGQFLNGNIVRDNLIGVNNVNGDRDFSPVVDLETTGVLVATVDPLSIEVKNNVVRGDHFGVWTTGPATVQDARNNVFVGVAVPVSAH